MNDNLCFSELSFHGGRDSWSAKKVLGAVTGLGLSHLVGSNNTSGAPFYLIVHSKMRIYREFWDIILILDREFLGSELQLASAQAFRLLFDLVDQCDRVFIPTLSYNRELAFDRSLLPSKCRENPKVSSLSRFTRLCQWALTPPKKRALISAQARLQHLKLSALSNEEIRKQLEYLRGESAGLPLLHRHMLLGIIDELQMDS